MINYIIITNIKSSKVLEVLLNEILLFPAFDASFVASLADKFYYLFVAWKLTQRGKDTAGHKACSANSTPAVHKDRPGLEQMVEDHIYHFGFESR